MGGVGAYPRAILAELMQDIQKFKFSFLMIVFFLILLNQNEIITNYHNQQDDFVLNT